MIKKDKQSYQFDDAKWLMSPSWEIWTTWLETTSRRQKQLYFDSKIGNIYDKWALHRDTMAKLPGFRLVDPYILISVKITREHFVITLLPLGSSQTLTIKHKIHSHWYASLYQACDAT